MKAIFKEIEKPVKLTDAVLIGDYEEVADLELSSITKKESDKERLNGLIVKGYETKFADGTNTNGERYSKTALDKFMQDYYGAKRLNMPVTMQHDNNQLVGRVLICEVNSVGFYFVCYLPKSLPSYERTKALISEGIIQGLSKEGWCTKGKMFFTKEGNFDYYLIEEIDLTAVSLVATPANGNGFEKAEEIKNITEFRKPHKKSNFAAMFNK